MAEEQKTPGAEEKPATEPKTYTQDEVDALLQKEADRRVSEALKKAKKKETEAVKEAERLASMSADERHRHELEQRERAIEEKERQLALAENKAEAGKILSEKGLSLRLVDFVVAEDADTMMANITMLEKEFKASVKAEVEKRMGGSAPKRDLPPSETITRESFRKMSLAQQAELAANNLELYKQLTS